MANWTSKNNGHDEVEHLVAASAARHEQSKESTSAPRQQIDAMDLKQYFSSTACGILGTFCVARRGRRTQPCKAKLLPMRGCSWIRAFSAAAPHLWHVRSASSATRWANWSTCRGAEAPRTGSTSKAPRYRSEGGARPKQLGRKPQHGARTPTRGGARGTKRIIVRLDQCNVA